MADPALHDSLLTPPDYAGVESVSGEAMVVRVVARAAATEQVDESQSCARNCETSSRVGRSGFPLCCACPEPPPGSNVGTAGLPAAPARRRRVAPARDPPPGCARRCPAGHWAHGPRRHSNLSGDRRYRLHRRPTGAGTARGRVSGPRARAPPRTAAGRRLGRSGGGGPRRCRRSGSAAGGDAGVDVAYYLLHSLQLGEGFGRSNVIWPDSSATSRARRTSAASSPRRSDPGLPRRGLESTSAIAGRSRRDSARLRRAHGGIAGGGDHRFGIGQL